MDNINKILDFLERLVSQSDQPRKELYKSFYDDIVDTEKRIETMSLMYKHLSGIIAHADLEKEEYNNLKKLLENLSNYSY